jgi:hypothetical protein
MLFLVGWLVVVTAAVSALVVAHAFIIVQQYSNK